MKNRKRLNPMTKIEIVNQIIDLIKKDNPEIRERGQVYAYELSNLILIFNPDCNILYKLKEFETTEVNDTNTFELELLVILDELKNHINLI